MGRGEDVASGRGLAALAGVSRSPQSRRRSVAPEIVVPDTRDGIDGGRCGGGESS